MKVFPSCLIFSALAVFGVGEAAEVITESWCFGLLLFTLCCRQMTSSSRTRSTLFLVFLGEWLLCSAWWSWVLLIPSASLFPVSFYFVSNSKIFKFRLGKQVTQAKINNHQSRPNPVTIGRENRWETCVLPLSFTVYHFRPENIPPNFNVPPPNSYNNEEPRRKPMEEIALEPVHNQRSCIN